MARSAGSREASASGFATGGVVGSALPGDLEISSVDEPAVSFAGAWSGMGDCACGCPDGDAATGIAATLPSCAMAPGGVANIRARTAPARMRSQRSPLIGHSPPFRAPLRHKAPTPIQLRRLVLTPICTSRQHAASESNRNRSRFLHAVTSLQRARTRYSDFLGV